MLQPDTFSCNDCSPSASTVCLDGCEIDAATMLACGGNTVGSQVKMVLVLFADQLTYTVNCYHKQTVLMLGKPLISKALIETSM